MGVDVTKANTQAAQLLEYANQLRNAKRSLESYKAELSLNWIGTETQYVLTAISNQITKINTVINELESLQGDIKTVATQIRNEEIAAEEAARKAREEAERKAREEAERKAAEEEAKRQAEEAAKAEAERKAAEEAAAKKTSSGKSTSSNKNTSSSKKNSTSKKNNNPFSWLFG